MSFATAPSASLPIAAPNNGAAVFVVTALVVRTAAVVLGATTARVVAGMATVVGVGASVVVGETVVVVPRVTVVDEVVVDAARVTRAPPLHAPVIVTTTTSATMAAPVPAVDERIREHADM